MDAQELAPRECNTLDGAQQPSGSTNEKATPFESPPVPDVEAESPPSIVERAEYLLNPTGDVIHTEVVTRDPQALKDSGKETSVLEFVQTLWTASKEKPKDALPVVGFKGRAYIKILSPAVLAALRHIVNYYPGQELNGDSITIWEPYAVVVHHEDELKQYRAKFAPCSAVEPQETAQCDNRWAYKHIGALLDFVHDKVGEAVKAERERHARGLYSRDMLWLMLKPGTDVYNDETKNGEYEPYVVKSCKVSFTMGLADEFIVELWNLDVSTSLTAYLGLHSTTQWISSENIEVELVKSLVIPCALLKDDDIISGKRASEYKQSRVDRGRTFHRLQRKGCFHFQGTSLLKPAKTYDGLVMVDPEQWAADRANYSWRRDIDLDLEIGASASRVHLCSCSRCKAVLGTEKMEAMFTEYDRIQHRLKDALTEHQYFLCSRTTEAFVFKTREWTMLDVAGFKDPVFDKKMINDLVLAKDTKEMITGLTELFVREQQTNEEQKNDDNGALVHSPARVSDMSAWSADFVKGKGQGLIFLLHGKPGVGKTYTAECVAALTERPLLALTCADIGINPVEVETSLRRWFGIGKSWGAIMLIDEADIYMEQRKVQDLERNYMVAGFLRALEYYQGILFLTTNRVGIFDEAFISRIHIMIHYPAFDEDSRKEVWESFFRKLQTEREGKMKILEDTRDYVTEKEVEGLEWNGREIRNAFQIAVALAQVENDCDAKGRIQIKRSHIRSTVRMSQNFKSYLMELYQKNETQRAAAWGHRYDAFGKKQPEEGHYK